MPITSLIKSSITCTLFCQFRSEILNRIFHILQCWSIKCKVQECILLGSRLQLQFPELYVYKNKNFRVASAVTSPCYLTNRVPAIHMYITGLSCPSGGWKEKNIKQRLSNTIEWSDFSYRHSCHLGDFPLSPPGGGGGGWMSRKFAEIFNCCWWFFRPNTRSPCGHIWLKHS